MRFRECFLGWQSLRSRRLCGVFVGCHIREEILIPREAEEEEEESRMVVRAAEADILSDLAMETFCLNLFLYRKSEDLKRKSENEKKKSQRGCSNTG